MPVEFKKIEKTSRLLDPRGDFQETSIASQIRFDPLTGRSGRVAHFGIPKLARPDLQPLVEKSRVQPCPFCPEMVSRVTPQFPPDLIPAGRLYQGQAVVVPNLSPYDAHSAVVVATEEHFVPLTAFTHEVLMDVLQVSLAYLSQVGRTAGQDTFGLISWNYMPPAGASQLHPHLQLLVTDTPGNTLQDELQASRGYGEKYSANFWENLVSIEKDLGERYVGATGNCEWLCSFVPFGMRGDLQAIFPGRPSLWDLTTADLDGFCRGLIRAFRYLEDSGIYSFNLAFYPGLPGQDYFWTHVRLVPRISIQPALHAPDVAYLQLLYGEPCATVWPEEVAQEVRPYFA